MPKNAVPFGELVLIMMLINAVHLQAAFTRILPLIKICNTGHMFWKQTASFSHASLPPKRCTLCLIFPMENIPVNAGAVTCVQTL
jgi:hypothetical protein